MKTPTISVITPVYNAAKFIEQAIHSVLQQSFKDFEFIVINDGSTDGSAEIIDNCASLDPRIIAVHQENKGFVSALNQGLSMAKAPLIARMDADDISLPTRFEKQLAFLQKNPKVGVVGSFRSTIDEQGCVIKKMVTHPTDPKIIQKRMPTECLLAHPATMLRREAVLGVGGYRSYFGGVADYDLWLRLLKNWSMANLPEVLLLYRQHQDQITNAQSLSQRLNTEAARQAHILRELGAQDPFEVEARFDVAGLPGLTLDPAIEARFCLAWLLNLLAVHKDWKTGTVEQVKALVNYLNQKKNIQLTDVQNVQLFTVAIVAKTVNWRFAIRLWNYFIHQDPMHLGRKMLWAGYVRVKRLAGRFQYYMQSTLD